MDVDELSKLRAWRSLLSSQFSLLNELNARAMNGVVLEDRELILTHRIFYEKSNNREFSVCVDGSSEEAVYAFVKAVGKNNDVELLYIIVSSVEPSMPILREFYDRWMIRGCSRDEMDRYLLEVLSR